MAEVEKIQSFPNQKAVYGPINSWRLATSLGIDPIFQTSICSFDCIYCQLGKIQKVTSKLDVYVSTEKVMDDFASTLKSCDKIDIITFSGSGEPTLASNLGEISEEIRKIVPDVPQAILTNATTFHHSSVVQNLLSFDKVIVKIDACNEKDFKQINRPAEGITLEKILDGIREFKKLYKGSLEVQTMFLPVKSRSLTEFAAILLEINPELVQLNLPKRPYPLSWHRENRGNHQELFDYDVRYLKVISKEEISEIKNKLHHLTHLKFISS